MSNDLELIRRARRGEREAFDVLFSTYSGRLLGFAHRLTGNSAAAEDLVQEAFLAALTSLGGYRGNGAFFSWLCGIVVRKHRDSNRGKPIVFEPPTSSSLDEGLEVRQAIDSLGVKHREAFLLVKVLGLTYDEAGQALRKPAGTVKWLCSEAATQLRSLLAEEAFDAK